MEQDSVQTSDHTASSLPQTRATSIGAFPAIAKGSVSLHQDDLTASPTYEGGPASVPPSYVYAIGTIEPRFPSIAVEKEFAQAVGREETQRLTDSQALHKALAERHNRYLVRKLCWVMTIEGLEHYILRPQDSVDFDLLVESIRSTPRPTDLDVVIGWRGPLAPADMCNGLIVPVVGFNQIYSFDRDSLIASIPRPERISTDEFGPAAEELFDRIVQMADNAGATNEHRALNYLAVRYKAIYATAAECFARGCSLSGVEVRPSRLGATRSVVDVIFSYSNRQTDVVEKYFARVDVTEEFPFLVTKMSAYYDR